MSGCRTCSKPVVAEEKTIASAGIVSRTPRNNKRRIGGQSGDG